MNPSAFPLLIASLWLLSSPSAPAADSRTWTDTAGRTLEGSLVRQEASQVWVQRSDGREVPIDKARLSPADLAYLKTQPASPTNPAASTSPARPGTAKPGQSIFKTVKIDKTAWKASAETFHAGGAAFPQRLATQHYLILATAKVKPDLMASYGEAAERTFADCVRDLPGLASVLKEKKIVLWLLDTEPEYLALGNWLRNRGSASLTWEQLSMASARLPEETAEELKVLPASRAFRTDRYSSTAQRSPTWPTRLHFLVSDILLSHLDDVADSEPAPDGSRRSFSTLRLGYCFYKEWQIAGKIDTEVSISGTVVEGFQNGRRWADAVRKVLKNPAGRPSLEDLLKTRSVAAQPIDIACAFGMMQFFNSDPARFKAFDTLLLQAREAKTVPTAESIAKSLGFDSPAAFDSAWIEFMASDAFK